MSTRENIRLIARAPLLIELNIILINNDVNREY